MTIGNPSDPGNPGAPDNPGAPSNAINATLTTIENLQQQLTTLAGQLQTAATTIDASNATTAKQLAQIEALTNACLTLATDALGPQINSLMHI